MQPLCKMCGSLIGFEVSNYTVQKKYCCDCVRADVGQWLGYQYVLLQQLWHSSLPTAKANKPVCEIPLFPLS